MFVNIGRHIAARIANALDPVPVTTELGILRRARRLMNAGFTKGKFWVSPFGNSSMNTDKLSRALTKRYGNRPFKTNFCAIGSLSFASGCRWNHEWEDRHTLNKRVEMLLTAAVPETARHHSIVGYNDAKDTTKADMLAVFDRAIANATLDAPIHGEPLSL